MKQQYITILLTILMSMVGIKSFAYDAEIDGIYYNFSDESAIVTSGTTKYNGDVVIPASVIYSGNIYSVTSIGAWAFEGCSGMTSITIPQSVTSIGGGAFFGCSGLTSVTIGNRVTTIGDYAFTYCSITSVKVLVTDYSEFCNNQIVNLISSNIGGSVYLIDEEKNEIKEYVIPEGVTSIGSSAFKRCSGLTSITIPNSVTNIGSYAFSGCSGLTSITIPNSVTSIGRDAFAYCSSLTSVKVPVTDYSAFCNNTVVGLISSSIGRCVHLIDKRENEITEYVIPEDVTTIGSKAFANCSGLTSITIPNSVTSIGERAFEDCSGLTSITIPNSVTSIGYSVFANCSGLTSVTIPNSVTSIENSAFSGCSGLTMVKVPVTDYSEFCSNQIVNLISSIIRKPVYLIDGEKNEIIKEYVIPEGVTWIGSCAFYGCSSLTSVTIPNSVMNIGERAFYNCNGLTSVTIGNRVTTIGDYAFTYCSITSVKVLVTDYSEFCNNQIVNLISSNIGGSVYLIDEEKNEIKEYVIPEGVTSIGSSAFKRCSGLTSITIPNSVTNIGSYAFSGCSGLTSITIPNSVTSIGSEAFSGCSGLTSVTFHCIKSAHGLAD